MDRAVVPQLDSTTEAVLRLLLSPPGGRVLSHRQVDRLAGASPGYASRVYRQLTGASPDPKKAAGAVAANRGRTVRTPAGPADRRAAARQDQLIELARALGYDPPIVRRLGGDRGADYSAVPGPVGDVLTNRARWAVETADALEWLRRLPDGCADLTVCSPPYEDAREYGELRFNLRGQAWVDWLAPIVAEAARVTAGLVCVVLSGRVENFRYSAAPELLVADLIRAHGLVMGPAPYAWKKNGALGSGGDHYHRRNWEPVYCFCRPDRLPLRWSDPLAFGEPPKHRPKTPRTVTRRRPDGNRLGDSEYAAPDIANPGNVIRVPVGGGNLGHDLAHENEAPYPVALAERFVCWFAPPGSVVCDPFMGSGTSSQAALRHGRRFLGCDIRGSLKLI